VAAVALIIDYIVTVAVQTAAGTDAFDLAFLTWHWASRSRSSWSRSRIRQPARIREAGRTFCASHLPLRRRDRHVDHHRIIRPGSVNCTRTPIVKPG